MITSLHGRRLFSSLSIFPGAAAPGDLSNTRDGSRLLIAGIALALLVCTIVRACIIALTPDEGQSYFEFVKAGTWWPSAYIGSSANNHLLNSWMIRGSTALFGSALWALRLPNLLAHVVFLFYTAKLSLRLGQRYTAVFLFILFNAHPYLLDFFSLARGYGLSMAGLAAALYYAHAYICNNGGIRTLGFALLALLASTYASLILVNVFIGFCIVLPVFGWINYRSQRKFLWHLAPFLCAGLLTMPLLPHMLHLREAKALYHGSDSLWEGTVKSLCERLLYDAPYAGANHFCTLKPLIKVMIAVSLLSPLLLLRSRDKKLFASFAFFLLLVFGLVLVSLYAQHVVLNVLYPWNRTGLFLFVLFVALFLTALATIRLPQIVLRIVLGLLALPVALHCIASTNGYYVQEWKSSGQTELVLQRLIKNHALQKEQRNVFMVADGLAGLTMRYMARLKELSWLTCSERWDTLPFPKADYYLIESWSRRWRNTKDWRLVDSFSCNGNALYIGPALLADTGQQVANDTSQ